MKKFLFAAMLVSLVLSSNAMAGHPPETTEETFLDWGKRIHFTGTLEADYSWAENAAIDDNYSTSDLFISTVELGVVIDFTDWITGEVLFLKEDIGTSDETDFEADEAMVTIRSEDFAGYLAVGKRAQPFGVFENHLLNDPLTQDAYETNRPGVTTGVIGPMDLDISVTAYRGEEMMTHLFESELFDAEAVKRVDDPPGALETDEVNSYIISASIEPIEALTLFASFLSEPGRESRNETLNVGASVGIKRVRLDAEYMLATNREKYVIGGIPSTEEFRESVLSVGAAYEVVLREREVIGGALFAERKAHTVAEPLEVAVRFEYFDDDGLAEASNSWALARRVSVGARYSFYSDPSTGLAAFVGAEYRYSGYNMAAGVTGLEDDNSEILVRLGVTF